MRKCKLIVAALSLPALLACQSEPMPRVSIPSGLALPGIGIQDCRVGQDASSLGAHNVEDLEFDGKRLESPEHGVVASIRNRVVDGVMLVYQFDGMEGRISQPYGGVTLHGIGSNSTIEQVIEKFGEPVAVSVSPPGRQGEVCLSYPTSGIAFVFLNDRLARVGITAPRKVNPDFDYDSGDTTSLRSLDAYKSEK